MRHRPPRLATALAAAWEEVELEELRIRAAGAGRPRRDILIRGGGRWVGPRGISSVRFEAAVNFEVSIIIIITIHCRLLPPPLR